MTTWRDFGLSMNISKIIGEASEEGLLRAGKHLIQVANKTCPKRTGKLRDSAVAAIDEQGNLLVGYTEEYAVYVHENFNVKLRKPGRHKWLQMAAQEEYDTMVEIVADALREALQ